MTLAIMTLNGADLIRGTLSVALAQDYPHLDILVSDNASTDNTRAVIEKMVGADARVRVRSNDKTVPFHEHFGQCLRDARGEFFVFLGDDDLINPSFVSETVAVAMRNPYVSVVVPANATIDEEGKIIERFDVPNVEVFDGPEFICDWLHSRSPRFFANLSTLLTRTSTLRQFGGFQALAGGRNCDNLLFLQCALTGNVGFASAAEFNWRVYRGSYGNKVTPKQLAESFRQLVGHLKTDPATTQALLALPPKTHADIIDGISRMTAYEFLYHVEFRNNPLRWTCLRAVLSHRWDAIFWAVVLREMYRFFRRKVRLVIATASPSR